MYGIALALMAAALFGASTPVSKVLLANLNPFQLAGLLYLGAGLAMALPGLAERHRGAAPRMTRANLARLSGAVFFGGMVGPVLLLFGLRLTLAGSVSLLLNLEMVATAVLGVVLFREHLDRGGWIGVGGVVGAGVILSWAAGWPGFIAALLVVGACACWGLDNHLTALIDGITPIRSTFWKGTVAGVTNLTIGATVGPLDGSALTLAAALGVGALSYGASIALYIAAAQQLGATRAQAVFASAPFVGAVISFGVLAEPLGGHHLLAGGVLAISVALLFFSQHEHGHVHEAAGHLHSHRHDDEHHLHGHQGLPQATRHTHWHRHERLAHVHPHWPDIHHRHDHSRG